MGLTLERLLMRAYVVTLHGREIDTVYYDARCEMTAEDVRRDLIDHDGYDPRITVRKRPD